MYACLVSFWGTIANVYASNYVYTCPHTQFGPVGETPILKLLLHNKRFTIKAAVQLLMHHPHLVFQKYDKTRFARGIRA